VENKELNDKKLWESAYTVMNHPRMGPYMHGAGMVERTTGVTHYWLVRGPCTQSVVQELQHQLGKVYSYAQPKSAAASKPKSAAGAKPAPPPARYRYGTDRFLACLLLVGLFGAAVGSLV
jgi:hypothetical protein